MSLFNSQLKLQRPPKHTIQCHISSIASETDDLPFTQPQQQAMALCSCCHTPRAIDKCVGPKAVAGVAIWHRPKPGQRFEKGAIMYHWARAPFPGKAHEFMTHQDTASNKLMQPVASSPLCRPWRWEISCHWHYRY